MIQTTNPRCCDCFAILGAAKAEAKSRRSEERTLNPRQDFTAKADGKKILDPKGCAGSIPALGSINCAFQAKPQSGIENSLYDKE